MIANEMKPMIDDAQLIGASVEFEPAIAAANHCSICNMCSNYGSGGFDIIRNRTSEMRDVNKRSTKLLNTRMLGRGVIRTSELYNGHLIISLLSAKRKYKQQQGAFHLNEDGLCFKLHCTTGRRDSADGD